MLRLSQAWRRDALQTRLYQWLLLLGGGHFILGLALAFSAQSALLQPYFHYLHGSVATTAPAAEFQALLRTMVQLFGPTVASWGLLFSLLIVLYRQQGHAWIKPVIYAALLSWSVLDSLISVRHGLSLHLYLNACTALLIAVPLWLLRPRALAPGPVRPLRYLPNKRQTLLITGGSGFIGRPLVRALSQAGHRVLVLTRNIEQAARGLDGRVCFITSLEQIAADEVIDSIINLAGEPLAGGRWNPSRKAAFITSRVEMTEALLRLTQRLHQRPATLLSGSAVGYYGHHQDQRLDEQAPAHEGYSHQLCKAWEERAQAFKALGVRVCLLRIGIVLGPDGGPLQALRQPFEWGIATQLGHGRQWLPWIHLDDVLDSCAFLLEQPAIEGAVNLSAPEPVTQREFVQQLQARLGRPLLRVKLPAPLLRWLVGEMAEEVLLNGQRVIPARLQKQGYVFQHSTLASALAELIPRRASH